MSGILTEENGKKSASRLISLLTLILYACIVFSCIVAVFKGIESSEWQGLTNLALPLIAGFVPYAIGKARSKNK